MPAQAVPIFLSPTANADNVSEHWNPVLSNMIAKLAEKSKARVSSDPAFTKIREQLQDLAKDRGEVRLGDLRKRTAKEKTAQANSTVPAAKPDQADQPAPLQPLQSQDQDREQLDSSREAVIKECANILADAIAAD
jgi:hypothetical protein